MNEQELNEYTKNKLIILAKKLKLVGIYALRKDALIKKILEHYKSQSKKKPLLKKESIKRSKDLIKIGLPKETKSASMTSQLTKAKEPTDSLDSLSKRYPIPEKYEDTKIVLLVRDTKVVVAYWEISSIFYKEHNLSNKTLLLRVYDVTDVEFDGRNENYHYDITLNNVANNWYIRVPEPSREYCIDIGYITHGRFIVIARSNRVGVPRDGVSSNFDEEWMVVEELFNLSGGQSEESPLHGSMHIEKLIKERLKMNISSLSLKV